MDIISKIKWIILVWFFLISIKTNAQIFGYDGRSEVPTIKISKGIVYKKGRVVGKINSNTVYEYDTEFVPTLNIKGDEVYFINQEEDVDVVEEFGYILSDNKIYFSRDTTDLIYLTIKDEFVYRGPITGKQLVKIKGEYKFIELITILYFLEKI